MLRSFGYAGDNALRSLTLHEEEAQALAPLTLEWEQQARETFLRAYDKHAGGHGLYETLQPGRGLLGLYELQKALYELRYELDNRPDWVRIPLQGILRLMRP
jgi:maltose alpha-D-glucosyltransferase/alpha-amylase